MLPPRHSNAKDTASFGFTTRTEVANWYGISVKTFNTRLKEYGIELAPRKRISPEKLQQIFKVFGEPPHRKLR